MTRPCEICTGTFLSGGKVPTSAGPMRRLFVEGRIVALCPEHAEAALAEGVERVQDLCASFREASGARSLIDRRSPLDRRLFPPRPEGRRRGRGRRDTDPTP
jgi:hypothetical protein